MPYQWRVQSFSKNKPACTCVGYIDARDVQNHLDKVCGKDNWQVDFKEIKGTVYAGIGINVNATKDEVNASRPVNWVWKWDCGSSDADIEKEKSAASDALFAKFKYFTYLCSYEKLHCIQNFL